MRSSAESSKEGWQRAEEGLSASVETELEAGLCNMFGGIAEQIN